MNQTIAELFERKSVRVYEDRAIGSKEKRLILQSALQAPTAGNMALYSILEISDQTLKDRLAVTCDNQPFIAKAPLVLVFLADYQRMLDYYSLPGIPLRKPGKGDLLLACSDALIAAQNTVVAAQSMGMGSCYIGDILENCETHQELFGLPDYVLPIAMLCFGYPTEGQKKRRKPARMSEENMVFQNRYRRLDKDALLNLYNHEGPDTSTDAIEALCQRKYLSSFAMEMNRSVEKMLEKWKSN